MEPFLNMYFFLSESMDSFNYIQDLSTISIFSENQKIWFQLVCTRPSLHDVEIPFYTTLLNLKFTKKYIIKKEGRKREGNVLQIESRNWDMSI